MNDEAPRRLRIQRAAPWLDKGQGGRAMLWIMAIMVFLTVLAAALGLGTAGAARTLDAQLAGRLTVQIVAGDAATRDALSARAAAAARAAPGVTQVAPVDPDRLAALLEPWFGSGGLGADLPVPAMIDVDLVDGAPATVAAAEAAITAAVPDARIDRHAEWLAPVRGFIGSLAWLSAGVVALMMAATAAVVLLVARAGLDAHRATIDVLHMLGSTDIQISRLFQRRIARDTLTGGAIGAIAAMLVVALVEARLAGLSSEMIGTGRLAPLDWLALALVPAGFALLATLAARIAILGALRKIL